MVMKERILLAKSEANDTSDQYNSIGCILHDALIINPRASPQSVSVRLIFSVHPSVCCRCV